MFHIVSRRTAEAHLSSLDDYCPETFQDLLIGSSTDSGNKKMIQPLGPPGTDGAAASPASASDDKIRFVQGDTLMPMVVEPEQQQRPPPPPPEEVVATDPSVNSFILNGPRFNGPFVSRRPRKMKSFVVPRWFYLENLAAQRRQGLKPSHDWEQVAGDAEPTLEDQVALVRKRLEPEATDLAVLAVLARAWQLGKLAPDFFQSWLDDVGARVGVGRANGRDVTPPPPVSPIPRRSQFITTN